MPLKALDYKIICELIKNSKISDRNLAKIVGVSQPTVTRRRTKIEKEKMLDYTAIPNFSKLGFEILAISFYSWTPEANKKLSENKDKIRNKLHTFLSKHKNIFFTANGRGFGMERVMISVHKSYSDYVKLMQSVSQEWGGYLSQSTSFIVSLTEDVEGRELSFGHLAEYLVEKLTMT